MRQSKNGQLSYKHHPINDWEIIFPFFSGSLGGSWKKEKEKNCENLEYGNVECENVEIEHVENESVENKTVENGNVEYVNLEIGMIREIRKF